MCSGRLLLGPRDRWGEAGINLVSQPVGKVRRRLAGLMLGIRADFGSYR